MRGPLGTTRPGAASGCLKKGRLKKSGIAR